MLKKITTFIAMIGLISLTPKLALASHVSGGEVRYQSLGGNDFKITLILYWDCSAFDPGPTQSMSTTNSCGLADLNFTVNQDTAYEVSQLCPSSMLNSTCNGGILPGNKKNIYSAIITLPGACTDWTFSHTSCCRNNSTNVPANPSYTFYALLNNAAAPQNNSPYFTSQPLPYLCVGQQVCYSPGVVEQDGNSLAFNFIDAMNGNATTPVGYGGGYTGAVPMPGITISVVNGLIMFTPTMIGNFVVVFQVTERDINGVVIGTVLRDIEMVVVNCGNQPVACNSGPITNITGIGAVIIPPNTISVCENIPFSFDFSFTDPNPADSLSIISNISLVCPGALVTVTGANPTNVHVSWTAPTGTANTFTTFAVTVTDNACPVTGQQTVNYIMAILPATNAGQDVTICGSQVDTLQGSGPSSNFLWTVISGPPLVIGTNISCNTCANPIVSPTATTTYLLNCTGSNGCVVFDTITVFVVPDFSYNVNQSTTNSCLLDPVQLSVTNTIPAAAYTYDWSPATHLSNATIPNPVATFNMPGSYTYTLTVTSPQGCVKQTTLSITVAAAFSPDITASNDTSFCNGTATLNANFTQTGGVPPICGTSPTGGCSGSALTSVVGTATGSNTSTTWPSPYGNWYTSAVQQYLYTAAELNAAGIIGGKIDQLDFNVLGINGITTYHNYEIKMGCTNMTTFNSAAPVLAGGLFTVFPSQTINVAMGWNTYMLSSPYEWDGISNLLIQICFSEYNGVANYTQNCQVPYTTTAYVSSQEYMSDQQDECPSQASGFWLTQNQHPDVRMHYCSVIPNPADYTYNWVAYPAGGNIANATSQFTTGQPTAPSTDYVVTVTNINGGCTDKDTVHVDVINISTMHITPAGPYCTAANIDTLQVSVPIGTGVFSGPGIIDPILGVFDPGAPGALGFDTIHYTVSSGLCGVGDTSIVINVLSWYDPTINPVPPLCSSYNPITLTAVTPGGSWSGTGITDTLNGIFNPALPGMVGFDTIAYTIYTPCYSRDTIVLNVIQQQFAAINPPGGPYGICNAPIQITSIGSGGTWSGPGITGTINGAIFDPGAAGAGTHTIFHYISVFCGDTASTTIIVLPAPVVAITTPPAAGCAPITVNFTGTSTETGGNCYWSFGNGDTSALCNPSYTYSLLNSDNYYDITFAYTDSLGCADTATAVGLVEVYSQPEALFTVTPQPTDITDPDIYFHDLSTGVISTWNWEFGNGNGSTSQNPMYTYPDTGTYAITFIVANIHGCVDTTTGTVIIDPITTCYIPTGFSPDGNGINDQFRVMGSDMTTDSFEMYIFDRWGEKVYHSTDMMEGWNGAKFNSGAILAEGTYVYKVTYKDYKGLDHSLIGHVSILK